MWRAGLALLLAGCNQLAGIHDIPIDARPDVSTIDAPPLPVGAHYHYVVDHEYVPADNTQARNYGLDLNGDGTVDNELGMVLGTLAGMGLKVQTATDGAVDDGSILMLADLQTTDFQNATDTGFTIYYGANPMPAPCDSMNTCRQHLSGHGSFSIASNSPHDAELLGTAVSGAFVLGPGHLGVELGFITGAPPIPLDVIGARVRVFGVTASGITSGVLAGAVTTTDINEHVLPALAQSFVPLVARDCMMLSMPPGCGCVDGTEGKTLIGLFDTSPSDCTISVDEIKNNSLVQSLLSPDVTIEGQMALSFGVGITAVPALFAP
jgi:hypothetical protein